MSRPPGPEGRSYRAQREILASVCRVHVPRPGGLRVRAIGARVLTVLAILLALIGMVAFYVENTALDEDGVRDDLAEDDRERRDPHAGRGQVGRDAVRERRRGGRDRGAAACCQQGLAPVLAGLARSGADRAADAVLERPRVQTVWVEVTTRAQRQLVRLLDDDTTFIQTEGGAVVLDLRPIVIELGDQVAVIGKVAERLPESSGKIAIIEESQLETAQTITKILRSVANWMWLVALAVAALAIWLARGRRRIELRAIAIGLLVVGLLMLAVRRFAGDYLVDELVKDDGVKPAAHEAWSILTQVLADRAWVWIILGLVTLVGVGSSATPSRRAGTPRRSARPGEPRTTYAIAAVALLMIALLAPTVATSWVMALFLIALIVAGLEIVCRVIVGREAASPPNRAHRLSSGGFATSAAKRPWSTAVRAAMRGGYRPPGRAGEMRAQRRSRYPPARNVSTSAIPVAATAAKPHRGSWSSPISGSTGSTENASRAASRARDGRRDGDVDARLGVVRQLEPCTTARDLPASIATAAGTKRSQGRGAAVPPAPRRRRRPRR